MEDKKEEEATQKVNAPEPTEESGSDKDNPEDSKEEKVEVKPEEIAEDYLEEKEEDKPEIDYKERFANSTREYQTLKKEKDGLSQAIDQLEELSKLNPKIVSEIEEAQKLSGKGAEDAPLDSGDSVQQKIDKAVEPIKKVTQNIEQKERLAKAKTLADFEKRNPDLFPPKATAEEKREIRQRIGKIANAMVDTGTPFKKAVSQAYLSINPKAAEQKGKDKAYLEGIDEERAGFSSQTSTEGAKSEKIKYSNRELEIGDKMRVGEAMRKDKK